MAAEPARPTLGLGLALLGASSYGVITTFSALAYQAGAATWTAVLLRFLAGAAFFAAPLLMRGEGLGLPRRDWPRLVVLAVGIAAMTAGYLSAVAYIPVGLAALLFFTFPLMVAATAPLVEGTRLGPRALIAYPLAFAGLAMSLGPSFAGLDWRGIALALFGALGASLIYLSGGPLVARVGLLRSSLHANLLAGLLVLLVYFAFGEALTFPETLIGWSGLAGATFCYLLALACQLLAVRHRGAAGTAVIFNLEPLVSIGCAALLLGERLSLQQGLGVALVMLALGTAVTIRQREADPTPGA